MMRNSPISVLPDLLTRAVTKFPQHGVGFVRSDKSIQTLVYPELEKRAHSILMGFQSLGVTKGDKMILSLDRNDEIIPVLWACFLGGVVPVLLQPPHSFSEYNPAAEKAEKVFRILNNPWVVLSHEHIENWRLVGISENLLLDFDSLPKVEGIPILPQLDCEDLALVQFSSGSTGDPKGVMLTHKNILTNVEDITNGIQINPFDYSVNWMPLYHDMGLIGFHLTPVYNQVQHFLIDPADFIKNPLLWLEIISSQKIRITACPNFGQVLINRYLARRKPEGLDFSTLRVIFNGAEPISVATMDEFISNMGSYGCPAEAMFPAYGMAEATLAATFPPLFTKPNVVAFDRTSLIVHGIAKEGKTTVEDSIFLVNLGRSLEHTEVRIVGDDFQPIGENIVGHVQLQGDNVTKGYIHNPVQTQKTIIDGWLHTGDLGFIYQGDLFITGRSKDIIFINGTNYYSHDLESLAVQVEDVTYGKVVIGGYFDEEEGRDKMVLFLVGSDNESTRAIFRKLKGHFLTSLGLTIDTFVPIRSNEIPHTSSGKIQRYKMISKFLTSGFSSIIKL